MSLWLPHIIVRNYATSLWAPKSSSTKNCSPPGCTTTRRTEVKGSQEQYIMQDSFDHCPMLVGKYRSKPWHWSKIPLNTDHCPSMLINTTILIGIDQHWSALGNDGGVLWYFSHYLSTRIFFFDIMDIAWNWNKLLLGLKSFTYLLTSFKWLTAVWLILTSF